MLFLLVYYSSMIKVSVTLSRKFVSTLIMQTLYGPALVRQNFKKYCPSRNMQLESHFVGNKAKGRISKRVFQESKAYQNF